MKKWTVRIVFGIFTFFVVAVLVYHLGLRNWCLHWGTTAVEAHATLPGDDLFPVYSGEATHAITIHASPQQIWPWLMQIGQDRGGFYSYTFLENAIGAGMPKVERLMPEWKPRAVGETVWFGNPKRFNGEARMIAAVVDPGRAFVMVMPNDWANLRAGLPAREAFWSFTLQSTADGNTRLIARLRGGETADLRSRLTGRLFWEPAHFVMEQKMLRTIRDLAERG